MLTPEQRSALIATIKNMKAARPKVEEIQELGKALFFELLRSPTWSVWEAPAPEDGKPPELWRVGAPKIIDERPPEEA